MFGFLNKKKREYEKGYKLYTEKKYSEAIPHLEYSANKGYDKAQILLGDYYDKNLDLDEDSSKTVAWYKKAAKQGNAEAQYKLAVKYSMSWDILGLCLYHNQQTVEDIECDCCLVEVFSSIDKGSSIKKSYNRQEMEIAYDKLEAIVKNLLTLAMKQGHKEAKEEYDKYFNQ